MSSPSMQKMPDAAGQERPPRKRRNLLRLFLVLALVYGAIVLMNPWAIHMGGGWTPLLIWTGTGKLGTASGTYPLFVTISPASHFSRLRLDGLRPTGGVDGWGSLCTAQGKTVRLRLYGTIYGNWRSTDGALISLRLLERLQNIPTIQDGGYFDLFGYWRGAQLVLDDRNAYSTSFRSGVKVKGASVILRPGSKSEFDAACAATSDFPKQQK